MKPRKNLKGRVFHSLTVIALIDGPDHHSKWMCLCICGKLVDVFATNLVRGLSKSCGCYKANERHRTHGMTRTKEYRAWRHAKERCTDPKTNGYRHYGGRGITMCPEWLNSFDVFFRDMGPCPGPEYSIERIDTNGNYEPENCCWLLKSLQTINRRMTRFIEHGGVRRHMSSWAREFGTDPKTLQVMLDKKKMSMDAISAHLKVHIRKSRPRKSG